KNGSREYLFLSGNSSFVSIYIDGRDCCQTGQFSQDVADGALTPKTQRQSVMMKWCKADSISNESI
ncbi:hypothetical protein J4536_23695, partial [Escherichia coli]|nr:hypothetical protein [Escherichia coli]